MRDAAQKRVTEGRAAFAANDIAPSLGDAATLVSLLTHGSCDGFLAK